MPATAVHPSRSGFGDRSTVSLASLRVCRPFDPSPPEPPTDETGEHVGEQQQCDQHVERDHEPEKDQAQSFADVLHLYVPSLPVPPRPASCARPLSGRYLTNSTSLCRSL